ncbi:hypothetical protein FRUB_07870 [Fimbriiglobus ruber]|uniref:Uncharacterized protein n=1 Tax=Fimbriiglobus ruber TaxID=1908690 RepID=A0A225DEJ8_9BACT|nr:hypothetical protein FRUB_07870 [Fimbriiglobus ruber]
MPGPGAKFRSSNHSFGESPGRRTREPATSQSISARERRGWIAKSTGFIPNSSIREVRIRL